MSNRSGKAPGFFNIRDAADGLKLGEDGIWRPEQRSDFVFIPDDETDWYQVQDESFWYRHRNRCFLGLLGNYPPPGPLLEIGSGGGYVAKAIEKNGYDIVALEPDPKFAAQATKRGVTNVVSALLEDVSWRPGFAGAIGLFDVLEHVDDEIALLSRVRHLLRPGGRIYVSVPAYQWLWSKEDEAAEHRRRYTISKLTRLLKKAGFKIEYSTYFFTLLIPAIFFLRALPTRLGIREDRTDQSTKREHVLALGAMSKLVDIYLMREVKAIQRQWVIPCGASCLAVGQMMANNGTNS